MGPVCLSSAAPDRRGTTVSAVPATGFQVSYLDCAPRFLNLDCSHH